MLKRLYQYIKPYRLFMYLAVAFLLLELVANIGIPWIAGRIIDLVFRGGTSWDLRRDYLHSLLLLLALLFIALALSVYGRTVMSEWFSQKASCLLRNDLFSHMQKLDMSFYHRNTVGELMSRVTSDVEQVRNYWAGGLMSIVFNSVFFSAATLYMLYLNWQLTLLCLLVSPVIAAAAMRFSRIGKVNQQRNRKAYDRLSATAQESLNGIRLIQNFMSQDYEIERFRDKNRKLTEGRQRSLRNWAKYMPILELLGSFSNILALMMGGYMVIRGEFSLGTWIQFISYTWMLVMPMRQLGDLINIVNFARVSGERLFNILDTPLRIRNPEGTPAYVPPGDSASSSEEAAEYSLGRGELEFVNVCWNGSGPEAKELTVGQETGRTAVLQDINIRVPAGSSLGIIGETGAGKTTLANLICRFADPDRGRILLDGIDLRQWDLATLRAQISYVMQEPFLFSETLSYNISFDQPFIAQDKVIRSAQRSAAHGFIGMLAQGYQTVVGERGVGLSGGQRQRTALARALVKEAPILILDDTTSAVDMETEKEIQEQLAAIDTHHTHIIIAHRLSSVMNCDQIIAMKEGRIIECGTHAQLMKEDGYYCHIFTEQQLPDEEQGGRNYG